LIVLLNKLYVALTGTVYFTNSKINNSFSQGIRISEVQIYVKICSLMGSDSAQTETVYIQYRLKIVYLFVAYL